MPRLRHIIVNCQLSIVNSAKPFKHQFVGQLNKSDIYWHIGLKQQEFKLLLEASARTVPPAPPYGGAGGTVVIMTIFPYSNSGYNVMGSRVAPARVT